MGFVHLADGGIGFAEACRDVVRHCAEDRDRRLRPVQPRHEWDDIAEQMGQLLDQADRAGRPSQEPPA